jgi:hypothetical protein
MRFIRLSDTAPLASGSTRDVYLHPHDDNLLIKVMQPRAIEDRHERGRLWYKRRRRYRHFTTYLWEVREQIALRAHSKTHPTSLQKIVGFADTDLGFGLVVEAAKDRQGTLAPTLAQLIDEGRFDAVARADFKACLDELTALPVILADLWPGNLVYAWSEEHGDHFVLIDGVGCKNLIPLNRMSRLANWYTKRRRIRRLIDRVEHRFSRATAESAPVQQRSKSHVSG